MISNKNFVLLDLNMANINRYENMQATPLMVRSIYVFSIFINESRNTNDPEHKNAKEPFTSSVLSPIMVYKGRWTRIWWAINKTEKSIAILVANEIPHTPIKRERTMLKVILMTTENMPFFIAPRVSLNAYRTLTIIAL